MPIQESVEQQTQTALATVPTVESLDEAEAAQEVLRQLDSAPPSKTSSMVSSDNFQDYFNSVNKKLEEAKDQFGATKALRTYIDQKYEIIDVIGKGSYGCVSRGICKRTGRKVALKIMINQTESEADMIKILREIKIMRKLNAISRSYIKSNK